MIKKLCGIVVSTAILASLFVFVPARAAVTVDCQVTEVTFGIDGTTPANADDCIGWDDAIGSSESDEADWVNVEWDAAFGGAPTSFEFITKYEGGAATGDFAGVDFTLTADSGSAGDYVLEWTDNGSAVLPENFDLVFVAKAAGGHGAFLFDDITLSDSPATGGGTFSIGFENNGGQNPALSHLTMLARLGDGSECCSTPNEVVEPSSLGLLLGGISFVAIRRRLRTVAV